MINTLVSVIVPVYNVERYLDACLISLERQTLKDIEVILVNDGSTDKSKKIAQTYADRNENFRLVDRENGGLSAARNTGLEYAVGKYVYFIDSDDYLQNTALEELYQRAETDKLDVLKFGAYSFEDGNDEEMEWEFYKYKNDYSGVYTGIQFLKRMRECREQGFPSCCMIFTRRDVIEKNSLLFYEGIIHEDNLFYWELMAVSTRVSVLNKPLYCRRYRKGSITTTPQYYNKWRSLVLGAAAAEQFYRDHVELKGTGIDVDYHEFLFSAIKSGYMLMDKSLRKTEEAIALHKIERRLLLKWHDKRKMDMLLYVIHPDLYISTLKIARKIFH